MRDLNVNFIELDEIWSYIGKKQARVRSDDAPEKGDAYTFTALDATSKAFLAYRVGKRTSEHTQAFVADLRERVINRPQISSDASERSRAGGFEDRVLEQCRRLVRRAALVDLIGQKIADAMTANKPGATK